MEKKFNIGDNIICDGFFGRVINSFIEDGKFYYDVEWDDGEVETVEESDIELIDRRDVFLSKLKGLLEEYGAEIELLSYDLDSTQLGITSNEFEVEYPIGIQQITAKNIMDYDKK